VLLFECLFLVISYFKCCVALKVVRLNVVVIINNIFISIVRVHNRYLGKRILRIVWIISKLIDEGIIHISTLIII
jgi:hypothetical protein